MNMKVLHATYKIEQQQAKGNYMIGTCWLVKVAGEAGDAKIALVTAFHVFDLMKETHATISLRLMDENGKWFKEQVKIQIRDENGNGLWLRHPERDIAALWVNFPQFIKDRALDFNLLADEKSLKQIDIGLGDELLALGYPKGLAANGYGFPILRSGKVSSYPIVPIIEFPSFLMDFSVFAGNSGGPVYVVYDENNKKKNKAKQLIMGIIAQQVSLDDERLEIGIVLHASFVRDLLMELLQDDHDFDLV